MKDKSAPTADSLEEPAEGPSKPLASVRLSRIDLIKRELPDFSTSEKALLAGEFLFQYTRESIMGLLTSSFADSYGFIPIYLSHYSQIQIFIGYSLGTVLVLNTLISILPAVATIEMHHEVSFVSLKILSHILFVLPIFEGVRKAFLAEQIKLPERSQWDLRVYMFLVVWLNHVASFIYGLVSLMTRELVFLIINTFLVALSNVAFLVIFILLRPKLVAGSFQYFAVERTIRRLLARLTHTSKTKPENALEEASIKFLKFVLLFLPFASYGSINILLTKVYNDQYVLFNSNKVVWHKMPYPSLDTFLGVILIPLIEFGLVKYLKVCYEKFTDLHCICISSVFIALAASVSCLVQFRIESDNSLNTGYGQINIFNALPVSLTIQSEHFDQEVLKHKEMLSKRIKLQGKDETYLSYIYKEKVHTRAFEIEETKSISYVITGEGLIRVKGYDPLRYAPPGYNHPERPTTFATATSKNLTGSMAFINEDGEVVLEVDIVAPYERAFFSIDPGTYTVRFATEALSYQSKEEALMKFGGVYSFVIYNTGRKTLDIIPHILHYPLQFHYTFTLPSMCLRNLAQAFGLIAMYHFTYFESPPTLRSISFGYLTFTHTVGWALHLWSRLDIWHLMINSFAILIHTVIHVVSLIVFTVATYFFK